jgi:hypothetical protein
VLDEEDEFDETLVPTLVPVYGADRIQADVVRSVLEGSGIPAVVAREGYAEAYPLTVGAIGEGRVMVREEDRERAMEVIQTALQGETELEDSDEEPWARPRWFLVLAAIICIGMLVVIITGSFPSWY